MKEKKRLERGAWPVELGESGEERMKDRQTRHKAEEQANRSLEHMAGQPQSGQPEQSPCCDTSHQSV